MAYALTYLEQLNRESTHRGNSRIFLMGWHGGGQVPVRGGPMGKVMCPNTNYMCVCMSSQLFVKIAHVLLLQIDDCWCGPLWLALTSDARFRAANLLSYLPLPGGLALICTTLYCICTALYCIYLSLTCFLLEETLNILLLCLTLSPINFFTQISVKTNRT